MADANCPNFYLMNGGVIGILRNISLGYSPIDRTSLDASKLNFGVNRNDSEGNPSAPCLEMCCPGLFAFKWVVNSGSRSITIDCKQAADTGSRPTLTVKANPSIGIYDDLSITASSSTGWVTLGPLNFTASNPGVVGIELKNNLTEYHLPNTRFCYWDHIVRT